MAKKKMTIEGLALMVKRGFDQTATKDELKLLATKEELHDLRKDMTESLRVIQDDIHDMKNVLGPLARVVGHQEMEIRNLHVRVARLERKAGFTK